MSESIAVIGTLAGSLAGTVLGFCLSEMTERRRSGTRRKKMIKSLIAELTGISNLISKSKKEGGIIEIPNLPLSTQVYDRVGAEIIGEINDNTLLELNQCYLEIGKINLSRQRMVKELVILNLDKLIAQVVSELKNALTKKESEKKDS